jgi:hypothetical protein
MFSTSGSDETAEGAEAGINYPGPEVRKGARGPVMLHMFLSFSVVPLFIDCKN